MDTPQCLPIEAHLHCFQIFTVITKYHRNELKYLYAGIFNSTKQVLQRESA